MSTHSLRIGLAGLGTVGGGVFELLIRNRALISQRAGRDVRLVAVAERDDAKAAAFDLSQITRETDGVVLANRDDIDVVVEVIGGSEGPARATGTATLKSGKSLVTANKALLAHHGIELSSLADQFGGDLKFEAAVAGGIPILKALREGLAANHIQRVYGILNGTCNYILSEMAETGRDFAEVLAEAQAKGYAEADPSFDIDGIDAAHKLALLTSLAFGTKVDFGAVHVEGIRNISALDQAFARELGFKIKLLGLTRQTDHGIEQRVHPCLVPVSTPIARVDGVFNAVVTEGDAVGRCVFEGRGAGAGPTASAIVADIIDIACGRRSPAFGVPTPALLPLKVAAMAQHVGEYYIRLMVYDRPGVMADVTAIMRDAQLSIESLIQRGRAAISDEPVAVVMVTHEASEAAMSSAMAKVGQLPHVVAPPALIRIERL